VSADQMLYAVRPGFLLDWGCYTDSGSKDVNKSKVNKQE